MRSHVYIISLWPDAHFAQKQFRNCTAQCKNSYFARQSEYSHFAPDNSGIVPILTLRRTYIYRAMRKCVLCHMRTTNICNNDYGVNIGQVTSSRLCRRCTNLRILSGISGVSRNKQNEGKISILGSQKSKKVTKILHSHQ